MKKYNINKKNTVILLYTILFFITAVMVYYGFWKANKTFIWNIDGFKQHFPAMYEFRENIRTALGSGLKDIPFWNWDLGLGFNLSFIYTYDMFYWLTIFLPIEWLVNAYSILIILKLYLSGLFLILYLFEINIIGYSSIIGGLVYSFCGYALFAGIRHPFFISPMVIFPLVILGIEKYFIKNKSGLLVISVFIATVSHYYFLYMIGIGSAIYTVVRCYTLKNECLKDNIKKVFYIGIKCILGIGIGAFALLPNICMFFQSNRNITHKSIGLFYSKSYYKSFIMSFISPEITGKWTILMFSAIVIIVIPLIFTTIYKKYKYIKIMFIIMTVMLLFPRIGSAMNGFSDVSNRWIFMYCFFIACAVSVALCQIQLFKKQYFVLIAITFMSYLIVVIIFKGLDMEYITPILFGILIISIMYAERIMNSCKNKNICKIILIFTVMLNITYVANCYYMPKGSNYIKQFVDNSKVIDKYSKNVSDFESILKKDKMFRTDQTYFGMGNQYGGSRTVSNDGLVSNINSSAQYISMMNKNIYEFCDQNSLFNIKMLDSVIGYDNRTILENLLSVKYKIINKNESVYLGKGYEKLEENKDLILYENKNVLPMGVFYSDYISTEDYQKLDAIDKSMSLVQGVVVEDENIANKLNKIEPKIYSNQNKFYIDTNSDIELNENTIVVKEENAEIRLITDVPSNCEIYLDIKNIDKKENSSKRIYVSRKQKEKNIILSEKDDIYDPNIKNKLICLGYTDKELKGEQIKIRFADKGTYTFDDINVKIINMEKYDSFIEKLKSQALRNIEYGSNYIKGSINATNNGIMFFSIPYDKGWSVEVDGNKVETLKVNSAFLGVPLKSGEHTMTLKFCPPGLKIGICITLTSIVIIGLWSYAKRKKD
ncbi:MAG: hypothetical protein Q607_CBUC00018G0030 [Clostridium butyricum DORA_1]|nr:MAG: hypothetical protein Q607_CBUC00018G0030 [Clostridium butyricum DORA_1]